MVFGVRVPPVGKLEASAASSTATCGESEGRCDDEAEQCQRMKHASHCVGKEEQSLLAS